MIFVAVYTASLDNTAKLITAGSLLLFAGVIWYCIRSVKKSKADKLTVYIYSVVIGLLAVCPIACYLYSPKNYVVGNFELTINRHVGSITIPVKDMLEIRHLEEFETKNVTRTWGVGGVFGYFGSFSGTVLGDMQWYVTNPDNMVLIRTGEGKAYVISPDDKNFVSWLNAKRNDL